MAERIGTLRTTDLRRWLDFLGIADCPCPMEWKSLGVLYDVNCGKGWVRTGTEPRCPHHGDKRAIS